MLLSQNETPLGVPPMAGAFLWPPGDGWRRKMASKSLIGDALWLGFVVFVAAIIGGAFH